MRAHAKHDYSWGFQGLMNNSSAVQTQTHSQSCVRSRGKTFRQSGPVFARPKIKQRLGFGSARSNDKWHLHTLEIKVDTSCLCSPFFSPTLFPNRCSFLRTGEMEFLEFSPVRLCPLRDNRARCGLRLMAGQGWAKITTLESSSQHLALSAFPARGNVLGNIRKVATFV